MPISRAGRSADPVEAFDQLVGESPAKFLKEMPAELRLPLNANENAIGEADSAKVELRKRP